MLPKVQDGSLVREMQQKNYRVVVDLKNQVLSLFLPKAESWRSPKDYRRGDTVRLTSAVPLKVENRVVAELQKGQTLGVTKSQQGWLETSVLVNGTVVRGSVRQESVELVSDEPPPHATLESFARGNFVAAAVLSQKAKQFDDGLYAAADLAAQQGVGKFAGKAALLESLARELATGNISQPETVLLAACKLGGVPIALAPAAAQSVNAAVNEFRGNELQSKPIGFYTWSDALRSIFQQDRMLQSELEGQAGVERIVKALAADKQRRATYEAYLNLVSQLTNPLVADDLRPLLRQADEVRLRVQGKGVRFFPASISPETELVKRMYPLGTTIPDGFNLADTLVAQVQSGKLDLKPRENSGWYDRQIWSLEPLVVPDRMPEAKRLSFNDEYRKHLVELFKGVWALARETHIKQLEVPATASDAPGFPLPKPIVNLAPQLHAEPLATSYLRRAESYRFVRGALEGSFGVDALKAMHRQTPTGQAAATLDDELRQMETLFHGAYVAVSAELGMQVAAQQSVGSGQGAEADARTFLDWAANLASDPDLGQDSRMMAPVFYDLGRRKTKAWLFLGWTSRGLNIGFAKPPSVTVYTTAGEKVDPKDVELRMHSTYQTLITPVVREVYVDRILNRDEFRQHCDTYQTTAAIVENLGGK